MAKESLYVPGKFEQQALLTVWNGLFWALLGVNSRPSEVRHSENIPEGPHLVAVNHRGIFEVAALENVYAKWGLGWIDFIAKKDSFDKPVIGWFFRHAGMIPIDRENPRRSTIRAAIKRLKDGRNVGIMPEGTRGRGEQLSTLKNFHEGAALIAASAQVDALPVAVVGTEKILPTLEEMTPCQILTAMRDLRLDKNKPEIRVAIGEPLPHDWGDKREKTQALRQQINCLIAELEL